VSDKYEAKHFQGNQCDEFFINFVDTRSCAGNVQPVTNKLKGFHFGLYS